MIDRLTRIVCAVAIVAFAKPAGAQARSAAPFHASSNALGSRPLLYVPASGVVDVYEAGVRKPKLLEQLTNVIGFKPTAVSVDRYSGNVYVLEYAYEQSTVVEYKRGQTSPFRTVAALSGYDALGDIDVARDGSIYVLVEKPNDDELDLLQLAPAGTVVRKIPFSFSAYPNAVATDPTGNVFVSVNADVLVYAKGATKPMADLPQPSDAFGLFVDKQGQLLVGLATADSVAIESLPAGKVLRTIPTVGAGFYLALDEAVNYLYASSGTTLQWYGYGGGRMLGFFSNPDGAFAVDPGPAYR